MNGAVEPSNGLAVIGRRISPNWLWSIMRETRDWTRGRAARRRNVGRDSYVAPSAHVLGWRSVQIGRNSVVGDGVVFNVNHRGRGAIQIAIGHSAFIGAKSFFSPGEIIEIGDYGLIGIDCKFLGSGHIFSDPFKPYVTAGTASDGRLTIGTNCWLGVGVTVLGPVSIGHGSVVGANSFVRFDIPAFSIAAGSPAKVLRRYDPIGRAWVPADRFTPEMEAALPDETTYHAMLETSHPNIPMPLRAAGKSQGDLP